MFMTKNESKSFEDEFTLIEECLEHGDLQSAAFRLNAIPDKIGTLGLQSKLEMQLFYQWFAFREDMLETQSSWTELNATQLALLETWSLDFHTWTGKQAKAILSLYYGKSAFIAPAFDGWNNDTNKSRKPVESANISAIQVFPVPANDLLTIMFKDQTIDQFQAATIRIYDLLGNLMFESVQNKVGAVLNVDVRNWASGVYMYQLELPHQRIESGKIEIVH
jgi:hypothetical protein